MMEQQTAIEKAIDVLYHLHAGLRSRGVSEIGRALGLPKSSAHRLLAALGRRGLVERDGDGRYRPGIALVALGLGVLEREPLVAAARPLLEEIARASDETAFLTVARGGRVVSLDKVEGGGFLRAAPRVGAEVPVHATAVGKLQLAFAADAVTLPPEPWPRFTPTTPAGPKALAPEVARARKRGWAENREEWIPGVVVVAVPLFLGGKMAASIAVAGATSRLGPARTAEIAKDMLARTRRLAARLELGSRPERQPGAATVARRA
jgi:DNA-binding IclR family transcriptional regulator